MEESGAVRGGGGPGGIVGDDVDFYVILVGLIVISLSPSGGS